MVSPPLLLIPDCPAPFINQALYPASKGFTAGRICSPIGANTTCCLPCPSLDWFYPDNFYHQTRYAGFIATASLSLCLFMLITWLVLPPEKTKRHHLNMSLVASLLLMELGVAIPVLRKPDRCADPITPSDQGSSMTCAWGGALIVYGFAATNAWIFSRAIQTHLLIVWDVPTPKNSFLLSQLFSWTLAGILLTTTLTVTGVSCRLGDYCFFNLKDSWASFWGPSLVFASITTFLTFGTAGYCLYVYVKSVYIAARPNSDLTAPSVGRPTAAAVWRRVRAVILLQWRPITIVVVLLLDLVTAIAVFVYTNTITGNAISHPESYTTWLLCLIVHPKNKDMCLSLVRDRNPWPATLQTPFVLLSLTGIVAFLVLSTSGMITGWYDLFRHLPRSTIAFIKRADDKGYTLYKRAYDHLHRGAKTTHSAAKSHWAFLTSIGPPAGLRIDVPILHLPTLPKLKLALPNFNRPSFNRKPKKSAGGITEPKRPRPLSGIKKSDISRPTNARLSIGPMVPGILSSLRQNELPGPIRIATSGKTLKMASRPSNDFVSSPLGPESQSQSQHGQDTNAQTDTPTETHASSPSRFSEVGLVPVTATPVRYSKEISSGVGAVGMTSGTDFDTPVSRRKGGSVRTSANGLLQHPGALAVGAAGSGAVAGAVARVGVSPLNFHPVVAESDTETETEMEVGNGGGEEEAVFEMDEDEDDEGAWSDAETERERPFDLGQSQGRVGEMDGDGMDREEDGEEDGEEEVDEVSEDDSLFYETSPSKMA